MSAPALDEQEIHHDLGILLDAYLDAILPLLQKDKYIMATGMQLSMAGRPGFVMLQPDTDGDIVDMAKHLQAYRKLLQKTSEHDGKAVLLAYDVRIRDMTFSDAIAIELQHYKGTRIMFMLPYTFQGIRKKLKTGNMQRIPPDSEPIM
jgi:hypothetical protein